MNTNTQHTPTPYQEADQCQQQAIERLEAWADNARIMYAQTNEGAWQNQRANYEELVSLLEASRTQYRRTVADLLAAAEGIKIVSGAVEGLAALRAAIAQAKPEGEA